jgi:hypothetical protein
MFSLQQKAETEKRASEAKVWSVLVGQVWAGFAGYCHAPVDLKEVSEAMFSNKLYSDSVQSRLLVPDSLSYSHNCCMASQNSGPLF